MSLQNTLMENRFSCGKSPKCRVRCLRIFTGEKSLSGVSLCQIPSDVPSNFLLFGMGSFLFLERVIKSTKLSGGLFYLEFENIIIKRRLFTCLGNSLKNSRNVFKNFRFGSLKTNKEMNFKRVFKSTILLNCIFYV